MDGKKCDVLIEDNFTYDQQTGIKSVYPYSFTLWGDEGLKDLIESVNGVDAAYSPLSKNEYSIYIDHRYDIEYVKEEVRARILIGDGKDNDEL